jgi:integrase
MLDANPFSELAAQVRGNRARQQFVTRDEIQKLIDAAPDHQWRTIIALARYGGLRVPSELLALKLSDVDLPGGKMTIRASKTEHHESGGVHVCPIFP